MHPLHDIEEKSYKALPFIELRYKWTIKKAVQTCLLRNIKTFTSLHITKLLSDHGTVFNNAGLGNYNDSVNYGVIIVVPVFQMISAIDSYIIAYPGVLVNYGVVYIAPLSYAHWWNTVPGLQLLQGRVVVIPHHNGIGYGCAFANTGSNPDNGPLNTAGFNYSTLSYDGLFQRCTREL